MKLWKIPAGFAAFALMASCDLGTPPQIGSGGGTEVDGVIVDQHGAPAANIWVRVYPDTSLSLAKGADVSAASLAIRDSARTNSNGAFTIPNLPSGTYNLVASLRRNDTTMTLFRRSIAVNGDLHLGTDTLRVAGSLTLNVSIQGTSISGAVCQIAGSPFLAISDLEGHCTLTGLPPGVYHVSVNVAGLPQGTTGPIAVVSLQVTPAGTLNLVWVAPGPPLTAPVLTAPAHNGEALNMATLSWNAVAAATSYDVQASTDSLFSAFIVTDTARAGLSRSFTVTNGTVYHWRVRARNSVSVSSWSPVRRFTGKSTPLDCIVAASQAPVLISPAHLAANLASPVSLTWGPTCGGSMYRVQVAKDSAFNSLAYQNDSIAALTVAVGLSGSFTYHWRVSARLSTGAWAAWSPARIFRTDSSATLSRPTLVSPANGATGVSTWATLSWNNTVPGANSYVLQLATDSTFNALVHSDTLIPATASTIASKAYSNLDFGRKYYWRVFAVGSNGASLSETRRFTTAPFSDGVFPSPATLSSPRNDSTLPGTSVTLSWGVASGASYYRVQVSTDTLFSSMTVNDSVTGTSRSVSTLAAGTLYHWRVVSVNASGSMNSATRRFATVGIILPTPVLLAPSQFAAGVSTAPILTWNAVNGATSYSYQVSTSPTFGSLAYSGTVTSPTRSLAGLSTTTDYYWRVKAHSAAGVSEYSSVYRFTTGAAVALPSAPQLISPSNDSMTAVLTPTLAWNSAPGATSYRVQVATDSLFASLVVNDSLTATNKTIGPLATGTQYHWRVIAVNSGGTSASAKHRFTTPPTHPDKPTLLAPANNGTGVSLSPTSFSWTVVSGATSYLLQVSTNSGFTTTVHSGTVAGTSATLNTLQEGTQYYWRVKAQSGTETYAYSSSSRFSTLISTIPAAPALILPGLDSMNVPTSPTLVWSSALGATSYHVQVSTDTVFANLAVNETLTATSKAVGPLSTSTVYYWRVAAINAQGSAYSARRRFTTRSTP